MIWLKQIDHRSKQARNNGYKYR